MIRPVSRAVLPSVQHWLRCHPYFALYMTVCLVAWGLAVGLTR